MRFPYFYIVGDKMPKYGRFKFGRIAKYGRYDLRAGSSKVIGPYVRYRTRHIDHAGNRSDYVQMAQERIDIPADSTIDRFRMRCNDGQWVYTQSAEANAETFKVRIRSIEADGGRTPWVYGEKGNLKFI
jgi:hypothetical protein